MLGSEDSGFNVDVNPDVSCVRLSMLGSADSWLYEVSCFFIVLRFCLSMQGADNSGFSCIRGV